MVQVVRGTRRVCNKRLLHQPASNSSCGSAQREPYNPFNHGRAEKAAGYSSLTLFVLASTLLRDSQQNPSQGSEAAGTAKAKHRSGYAASSQHQKVSCQSP